MNKVQVRDGRPMGVVWWSRFVVADKEEFDRRNYGLTETLRAQVRRVLEESGLYSQLREVQLTSGLVLFCNGSQEQGIVRLDRPFLASHSVGKQTYHLWCHATQVHRTPARERLLRDSDSGQFFRFPVWSLGERTGR